MANGLHRIPLFKEINAKSKPGAKEHHKNK